MLNVYAIVSNEPSTLPDGITSVRCEGLVLIVREVNAPLPLSEASILAHDAVVGALVDRCDGVLPARFGTLAPDMAALEDLVLSRLRHIRRSLELVAGARQMTLRVLGPSRAVQREPVEAAEGGAGSRYLRSRVVAAAQARDVPELAALRPALTPLVRAERAHRNDRPPLLATVYHLVAVPNLERYREVVAAAPASARFRLRLSGPWPAYAFGDPT